MVVWSLVEKEAAFTVPTKRKLSFSYLNELLILLGMLI